VGESQEPPETLTDEELEEEVTIAAVRHPDRRPRRWTALLAEWVRRRRRKETEADASSTPQR